MKGGKAMKRRSQAWLYFEKEGDNFVRCKLCQKVFKNSGNTTNLTSHVKRAHCINPDDVMKSSSSDNLEDESAKNEEFGNYLVFNKTGETLTECSVEVNPEDMSCPTDEIIQFQVEHKPAPKKRKLAMKRTIEVTKSPQTIVPAAPAVQSRYNNTCMHDEKPYDSFGRYIASELRSLPKKEAFIIQKTILDCIFNNKLSSGENAENNVE